MPSRIYRVGSFEFVLALLPTFLTVLFLVVLLALGFWQLARLAEKEQLLRNLNERQQAEALDVSLLDLKTADYHPATAVGHFEPDKEIFLHTVAPSGEGGYRVIVPFLLAHQGTLLVDRGFVPFASREKHNFTTPTEEVHLKGMVRQAHPNWLTPANNPALGDWYWVDTRLVAKTMALTEPFPFVLVLTDTSAGNLLPKPIPPMVDIPNNHRLYAITWFGLALVLLVIYGLSHCRRRA